MSNKTVLKPLEWAELWAAMKEKPEHWHQTTASMFEEMLGCVPPKDMGGGAFLVGEASNHNSDGEAVYACFYKHGDCVEARYMTLRKFQYFKRAHCDEVAA